MEHLNYSRSLSAHCTELLGIPSLPRDVRALLSNVLDLHEASTKFILPDGGRLCADRELRGLDENEPLRLPYKFLALEYQSNKRQNIQGEVIGHDADGQPIRRDAPEVSAPKRIVYARERGDRIVLNVAYWTRHDGRWKVLPECYIPMTGYLSREPGGVGGSLRLEADTSTHPLSDYMDEVYSLVHFLNILHCSNVHVERSEPRKSGKKVKAALPFDAYHVLTISLPSVSGGGAGGGSHRSPREHLRRGHIRRLSDGRRLWINATVVAAGRGSGVIRKDYAVKLAA